MNLQQLEYIIAVDNLRHFALAAQHCCVTQPTLSMMIQKLEQELGVQIFDRSRQPIVPTPAGVEVIEQGRQILREVEKLKDLVSTQKMEISGTIRIDMIPTLAPYLVPFFLSSFLLKYPDAQLSIAEHTTAVLVERLRRNETDLALLATPLNHPDLVEIPLFYEEFLLYGSEENAKQYILPEDIDPNGLWLLEEGHCLRSQILRLCELHKKAHGQLSFQAGSLETLRQLVRHHQGVTILPELAAICLPLEEQKFLVRFQKPAPVREISLVTHKSYARKGIIEALKIEILSHLPKSLTEKGEMRKIEM